MTKQGLILAAGLGKRMAPLSNNLVKSLLPVAGKPFIEWQIMALLESEVEKIWIVCGKNNDDFKEKIGNGEKYDIEIEYVVQEKQTGTADALLQVREKIVGDFYCLNGDVIVNKKTLKLLNEKERGMAVVEVDDVSAYGCVKVENGFVVKIIEKENTGRGMINAGIYKMNSKIFEALNDMKKSKRGEYELTTIIENERFEVIEIDESWMDIGTPWNLLEANEIYMKSVESEIKGDVEDGVTIKGDVFVSKGAVIKSGTYIEGSVWIGEGAVIGPNAYIRGATMLDARTKVGAASEVKNSIIMEGAKVPHHNYVGDSIIGRNVNLGSGTKIANLRLDKGEIAVERDGEKINTGRRKFGAILGDNVSTGINSSINVGTIIGSDSIVGAGKIASGTYPDGSKIL
ncbi:MAG: hypothetical protein BEU04_01195 [Marine Group III euryarchaeote CG-Bathy1]|uniref:Bifunctional protein GlmU n=1 Tax=Marine Group III euryarchaeote CG-Bathy1 TaxID=1889001 RepID=A0A1J5TK76_9ARCH|nr:MAG: hypothetical protein BEU04_01195 [Marine Group III euryarchaeote CG-Bathy1]